MTGWKKDNSRTAGTKPEPAATTKDRNLILKRRVTDEADMDRQDARMDP